MNVYVIHIKTGFESQMQQIISEKLPQNIRIFCPMRELMIRRKGKNVKEIKPMFPGYIFLKATEITAEILSDLKIIPGIFQVLPSNKNIQPISNHDLQFLNNIFNKNYRAKISKVRFDKNDRIEIIDGPLKGKEGLIVKVDKRKGRAKIIINAFDKQHYVDLGFEILSARQN